jgi:large repetitive protein
MKGRLVLVAAVVLALALDPITASADALTSSVNPSTVGQEVTFTAVYTVPCADGVAAHFFTIDGDDVGYTTHTGSGQVFTTTLTTSSLSAGDHAIVFTWSTSMPPTAACGNMMTLTQTVSNPAAPPPQPAESPSSPPVEAPSPSPSPTEVASAVRLAGEPARAPSIPTIPLGLIALAGGVIAGGAVVILIRLRASRR